MIENIDYHVTDRCNLKCVGCNNFCPFVPNDTPDPSLEQVEEDFKLLSKFKDSFKRLSLLGGEPTLHENLGEILDLARRYFTNNDIVLVSNGIMADKLLSLQDKFISSAIKLIVTVYPYCDNFMDTYNKIKDNFREGYLEVWDYSTLDDANHMFWFQTRMLSNDIINTAKETHQCSLRICTQYKDKKLYLCGYHANFRYFKAYFGDKVNIIDDDLGLDLTKCEDGSQIENYTFTATPNICMHCRAANKVCLLVPWHRSEKTIDEYIG